jgi:PucR family transcriptional regulator, purine catabolism regulatory protein
VGRGVDQWGRLIAVHADVDIDMARTMMVLERAAQALVIHRMAERGRSDVEHQAQAGLVDDVLRNRTRSEDEVKARAFALGLRPAARYLPATVRAREWTLDADPVTAQRRNVKLLDTVVRAVRALGHSGLFSVRGPGEVGAVLSLHSTDGATDVATLEPLGDALRRDGARDADGADLVLGVATPTAGLVEAIHLIDEAAHIAEVAASLQADRRTFFRVSDIRLRGMLSLLRGDPRVQRFAETELRALILHDIETGDNCLEVLRGYLELAHRKSALAQRLHLSRPALYAKLARIEHILGVDLADGESATSLHVAILIFDARNALPTQSEPSPLPP